MSIGKRIREARISCGLTQEDVAKIVGVATQTIYKYEKEIVTNIPLDRLYKIAEALNTTSAYLQGYTNNPDIPQIDIYKIMRRAEELRAKYEHDEKKNRDRENKWIDRFRDALSHILEISDTNDLEACSLDINRLRDIVNGDVSISFTDACSIADALELSLDEMVGLETSSTISNNNSEQFMELFSQLTTDQQTIVISQIKGILAN